VELLVGRGRPLWGRWYWLDPTAALLIAIVIAYHALATNSGLSWLTITAFSQESGVDVRLCLLL
jgi:Co/Zn/Cd efflux system component